MEQDGVVNAGKELGDVALEDPARLGVVLVTW